MSTKGKAQEDAANKVKKKLKKLEGQLTPEMPFCIIIPLGKTSTIIEDTYLSGKAFLIKTNKNKINIIFKEYPPVYYDREIELHYTNAATDLLILITDEKLSEFLNAIQEEFKKYTHTDWILPTNS